MLDRLTTIVDQLTDSVDLSAMDHLKNWHPFSRDKSTVRQRSLESTVVRVVLKIRCSTWSL